MNSTPKWVKLDRQNYLASLFCQSNGFCVYGYKPCKGHWIETTKTVCYWGKFCSKPIIDGWCKYKPDDNKPLLPCEVLHINLNRWLCDYGDYSCYKPYENHYTKIEDRLIKEWVLDDKRERLDILKAGDRYLHSTNERTLPLHGKFSAVSQDIYYDNQPEYFIEGLGISGLNFQPFAKVRLASSPIRLFVNIGDIIKPLSKNQRHKAVRYGKIPAYLKDRLDVSCWQAVRQFKR